MRPDSASEHLDQLRRHRNREDPDLTLGFLKQQFKRDIARPAKHLGDLVALWQQLVPAAMIEATRLESLSRGVLHVTVRSSVELYELDSLMRTGLERELVTRHAGPAFRKVKLKVGPIDDGDAPRDR